jgi:hypothetical protein
MQSTQLGLARHVGAAFVPSTYRQRLAVARGALLEERLTLFRSADSRFENDSGWLIFVQGGGPLPPEHDVLYAHELIKKRPALVQVLCLPPDYTATFRGDSLEGVGRPTRSP